nr:hypothetical protein [Candidatus Sigynarchaeum springense]MDO8117036.1 hypothetical protein [Candidatus Sigynarchaeota archaeon]
MSGKLRELEFIANMPLEEAWTRTFDFWKNQKVRTKPPSMENLPDGSRRMIVEQLMSFTSNGQTYQLVFKETAGGTTIHVWAGLTFGWGMQWAKPLQVIKNLAKFLGANHKVVNWLN